MTFAAPHNPTPPRSHPRAAVAASCLGVAIALAALSGCAISAAGAASSGESPEFSGAWAEDFREAYGYATTDRARSILADSQITPAEYDEVRHDFEACSAEAGVTITGIALDGTVTFDLGAVGADAGNTAVDRCSEESGESSVGTLWHQMQRNPEQLDENDLVIACLIRVGEARPDVTAEQFLAEQRNSSAAPSAPSALSQRCAIDPNGTGIDTQDNPGA